MMSKDSFSTLEIFRSFSTYFSPWRTGCPMALMFTIYVSIYGQNMFKINVGKRRVKNSAKCWGVYYRLIYQNPYGAVTRKVEIYCQIGLGHNMSKHSSEHMLGHEPQKMQHQCYFHYDYFFQTLFIVKNCKFDGERNSNNVYINTCCFFLKI